ncbi:hypothetical protein AX16_006668 [Volvariella volvacea WC 439]|nr:hypothetical protein AX16_006668 [Volvariella volvacea WC 439]
MSAASVPSGVACTLEEYSDSYATTGTRNLHCLTRGQTVGLMVVIYNGVISLVAVLCMFGLITRNAMFYRRQRREARGGSYYSLIEKPIDALLLSLFVADLIQCVGAMVSIEWVRTGKTEVGSICTAQTVLRLLGNTTGAMITSVIALYTLYSWYTRSEGSLRASVYVIIGVWTLNVLLIIIGNVHHDRNIPYASPTPYWCWVNPHYIQYQIVGEYMWFWIALALSLVAYVVLARHNSGIQDYRLLAYPIVYSIMILPMSVVRFIQFVRERQPIEDRTPMPSAATFAVVAIFNLNALFNVALTYWMRKDANLLHRQQLEPVLDAPMIPDEMEYTGMLVADGDRQREDNALA